MKIAYNKNHQIADIDLILDNYDNEYYCIHCNCEMVPAALNSEKVSPYFRAKNAHKGNCPVKHILTDKRYNNSESEIEQVYENSLKTRETNTTKAENNLNPERKRKERKYLRIRYLKQLVAFCLSNDIEESVGDKQVKSFFIDDRTVKEHIELKQNKIYLFSLRFRKYIPDMQTMIVKYPARKTIDEKKLYFYDLDVFYSIKNKIFNKDKDGEYKDIYVIAQLNKNGNIAIYNENQFYLVSKNNTLTNISSEVEDD